MLIDRITGTPITVADLGHDLAVLDRALEQHACQEHDERPWCQALRRKRREVEQARQKLST